MQDDAQNILLEIKHDIMDGQTFFPFFFEKDRMGNAETYSHAKDSLKMHFAVAAKDYRDAFDS